MNKEVFIKLDNVSKTFNLRKCINNISVEIPQGIKVAVVGPNLCGKTTLLRMIAGFYHNYEGTIIIDDKVDIIEKKNLISFLPDVDALPYQFKITDIEKIYKLGCDSFNTTKFNSLLKEFGIDKNAVARTLDKEKREWLKLILFVSRDAKLFIMDIPREGSAIKEKHRIREFILNELPKNATLLYAATQEKWIDEISDAIIYLEDGAVERFEYKNVFEKEYGSIKEFLKWMKSRYMDEEDEDE